MGLRARTRCAGRQPLRLVGGRLGPFGAVGGEEVLIAQHPQKGDALRLPVLVEVLQDRQIAEQAAVGIGPEQHREEARHPRGQQARGDGQPPVAPPVRGIGQPLADLVAGGHRHHLQRGPREGLAQAGPVQLVQQVPGPLQRLEPAADFGVGRQQGLDAAAGVGVQLAVEIGDKLLVQRRGEFGDFFAHGSSSISSPGWWLPPLAIVGISPWSRYGSSTSRRCSLARESSDLTACGESSMTPAISA